MYKINETQHSVLMDMKVWLSQMNIDYYRTLKLEYKAIAKHVNTNTMIAYTVSHVLKEMEYSDRDRPSLNFIYEKYKEFNNENKAI